MGAFGSSNPTPALPAPTQAPKPSQPAAPADPFGLDSFSVAPTSHPAAASGGAAVPHAAGGAAAAPAAALTAGMGGFGHDPALIIGGKICTPTQKQQGLIYSLK